MAAHHDGRVRFSMSEVDKLKSLREGVAQVKPYLQPSGDVSECIRRCLSLLVDYIEFMVTPAEDNDE